MKQLPVLLAVLYAALSPADAGAADRPPNIVFIMADDLGLGEVGCYGGKEIPTPNIDRLAAEGMTFTNAYSASAVCAPTRCGLMTGLHMGHATRRANGSRNGEIPLAPQEVTVAELLKGAGYVTGGFGKWGLGNVGTTGVPEKQGFDIFHGYYDQTHAHNYFPTFLVRNSVSVPMPEGNRGRGRPGSPGNQGKGDVYSPDLITDETLTFIEANKDRPFFCYAAWTLPHGQYEIPDASAFANRSWPQPVKNHAAMIARLDADVGRVVEKLQQLGLAEKTLVIFTSDNGAEGPGRMVWGGTAGLRGFKRHLYEGGIRAPFIARWPNRIVAGRESDLLTSHVDFLATACELAGVAAPAGTDSISIVPTLLSEEQSARHDWLYWEIYEGPAPFQQAVRMDHWKGYRTALAGPLELYNLRSDPKEESNVAADHPDVVAQIEGVMSRAHVRNPNWKPTNKPADEKNRQAG